MVLILAAVALVFVPLGLEKYRASRTQPAPQPAPPQAEPAPIAAAPAPPPSAPAGPPSPVEQQWGIQVASIRLSQAESAIDLRYTVVAPEKAAVLASDPTAAYLVDQTSGAKIPMLTLPDDGGSPTNLSPRTTARMMHRAGEFPPAPTRVVPGKVYSILLPNPGGALKSGSKVSLVVGNYQTGAMTVQ